MDNRPCREIPEYNCLKGAIRRCHNPDDKKYYRYGGRGIAVCERYRKPRGVLNLIQDIGSKPGAGFSLGRINNDGDYCPGNLRWETRTQQANNKYNNVFLEFQEKRQTVAEWARELKISSSVIGGRLKSGWSIKKALTTPVKPTARMITFDGETHSLAEWERIKGFTEDLIGARLRSGWSVERAITTPVRPLNHSVTLKGETKTIVEWSRITGTDIGTLKYRLSAGWDDDRILEPPTAKELTFNSETRRISEWSKITGLTVNTIRGRLNSGWSVERALSER